MKKESAIVIGAGLSGLECAYILAKNGMKVTVLEGNRQIGGCIQSFKRGGSVFDTGFHYVGGLGEGESLYPLFKYFHLTDLPWHRLDDDCFDEVYIGGKSYPFACGHAHFVERLAACFPDSRAELRQYTSLLQKVGDHIFDAFKPRESTDFHTASLFAQSASQYLRDTISDPLLRKVLSGTSLKMELSRDTLPLYVFAQINNSFIQSAWRLEGGGMAIARSLAEDIGSMGGEIMTGTRVTGLVEKDGRISRVTAESNGQQTDFEADWVISSAHPAVTLDLVRESSRIRKIYRKRIARLENTFGIFTANLRLKKGALPYLNRNLYLHREDADLWAPRPDSLESILVSFGVPHEGNHADTVDLLTPMSWAKVEKWSGHRDEDYYRMKEEMADECLTRADKFIPGLREAVDKVFTSTPLTYRDYTSTPDGSAYGIRKDYRNTMLTVLAPRTPVENLVLTGQNLNLHGILGVSMTSVMSSATVLGMDCVTKDIFGSNLL